MALREAKDALPLLVLAVSDLEGRLAYWVIITKGAATKVRIELEGGLELADAGGFQSFGHIGEIAWLFEGS